MESDVVKDAVRTLEAQGVPLAEITSPMIREITGYGSYTSITEHLRTIRGEPAGDKDMADGPSESEETALAVLDATPGDLVQEGIIIDAERFTQRQATRWLLTHHLEHYQAVVRTWAETVAVRDDPEALADAIDAYLQARIDAGKVIMSEIGISANRLYGFERFIVQNAGNRGEARDLRPDGVIRMAG
jgi:hypothetical protein